MDSTCMMVLLYRFHVSDSRIRIIITEYKEDISLSNARSWWCYSSIKLAKILLFSSTLCKFAYHGENLLIILINWYYLNSVCWESLHFNELFTSKQGKGYCPWIDLISMHEDLLVKRSFKESYYWMPLGF